MSRHLQTNMTNPFTSQEVAVDNEILPLITMLWEHGIPTFMSCQNIKGKCWIEFSEENAFNRTLKALLILFGEQELLQEDYPAYVLQVRGVPSMKVKLEDGRQGTLPAAYQITFNSEYIGTVIKELNEHL